MKTRGNKTNEEAKMMTTCPTTGLPLPKMPEGIERTTPREMSDKVRKQLAEDARTGIRKP